MANFAKIPQNITNLEGKNTWQNSTKASRPLLSSLEMGTEA
jgi:hypothetical protein